MTATAGARLEMHAGRAGERAPDAFGGRAAKLAVLLGLDRSASALVAGPRGQDWRDDLQAYFADTRSVEAAELARVPAGSIGLALVDADAIAPLSREPVAQLLRTLTPSGSLLLFGRNRLALRAAVRTPGALLDRRAASRWRYRRLLRSAGAARIEEFLPFPELWDAEEMVADRRAIALPSHASRIERLLLATALLPALHDGYLFIASGAEGGTARLRDTIARGLRQPATTLMLDRFDLRGRGALVLLLRAGGERLACRVTTNDAATERVRRNAEWVQRIVDWPSIPPAVRRSLPEQRDAIPLGPGAVHAERQVDGIVAWKLAGVPRIERVMRRALHDFTRELSRATARVTRLEEPPLSELLPQIRVPGDDETSALLHAVRAALRRRVAGRSVSLVIAHGDYGYGNAIAKPDGALAGVIDWDQARFDLAGVDLVNFLVQRASGIHALGPVAAFQQVAEQWSGGGPRGVDPVLDMANHFPDLVLDDAVLLAWTALRYVERAASYPALFATSRGDMRALLRWAGETVA